MKCKVNIVTLAVQNLEKARAFYENALAWKVSEASQGDIVFFNLEGIVFALYPREELAKDVGISAEGTGFSGVTLALNTQSESEVDQVLDTVKAFGAEVIKPAQKVFWGGYSGYFRDLDGHLFEVAYNPFVAFDEKHNLIM
ncbi:VOC family protein [Marinilongibacter aquaticus]|uniref:VOC family protein n=1 Tax=Marinilongibacter aquaticus TaxID=2975157 RepID=UPI0021BD8B00|nr:VOC family protein [Marinilongibacter aquaticus]UBM59047.1 VOC family protein [Marinilongibacter aquaticus]